MYHPECQKNEEWVGNNCGDIPEYLKHLKTARLGEQSFDIHGKKIPSEYYRPLFIGKSEYDEYDRIMNSKLTYWKR